MSVTRTGRRPGPSGTREAILAAASRQFAELGYDRPSLRAIAAEAGVDPGLVKHYFGTKQQLFVTVSELPFEPEQVLPALLDGDPAGAGERLARFFIGILESEVGQRRITGMVRAAASEPSAAKLMRDLVQRRIVGPVAEALGRDRPDLRAALVGSQMVGVVMARYVVAVEPLASADPEDVIKAIAPTLQRYLVEPL